MIYFFSPISICTQDIVYLCNPSSFKTWMGPSSCGNGLDSGRKLGQGYVLCYELTRAECEVSVGLDSDGRCLIDFCAKFDNPFLCAGSLKVFESFKNFDEAIDYCKKSYSKNETLGEECYKNTFKVFEQETQNCSDFDTSAMRDVCYSLSAASQKGYSLCEKIRDKEKKEGCLVRLVQEKNDVAKCDEFSYSYYRTSCYFGIAVNTLNKDLCYEIDYEQDKNDCLNKVEYLITGSLPGD